MDMTEIISNFPPYKKVRVEDLIPYANNSRTHTDAQVAQIAASIKEFGFTNPILVDADGGVIAGHGGLLAARKLGMADVPVIELAHLTDAQRRAYIIADNKLALNAGWDDETLRIEIAELKDDAFDLTLLGFTDLELEAFAPSELPGEGDNPSTVSLADRFGIPPFSVLNAREGWWQSRKRSWIALGIRSELGRGDAAGGGAPGGSLRPAMKQAGHVPGSKLRRGDGKGRPVA